MKIMLSAGEASGDLHGAMLAKELKKIDSSISLVGFGGNNMENSSVNLWANYNSYNVMGVLEVILNLRRILKLLDELTERMEKERPDMLVLIDYPDFNWRLAKRAKSLGIKVFSYIPPSAWAWRRGRAKTCAEIADEFVAIFPHELAPYIEAGAKISFLGNPLVDTVKPDMEQSDTRKYFGVSGKHIVLLLPGSRTQEINRLFPVMLAAARLLKNFKENTKFYLPVAESIDENLIKDYVKKSGLEVILTKDHRYDLMNIADFAIATSGTVVLEAALLNLPSLVVYKMSGFNYLIAKMFVNVPHISLPNLTLNERVLPEFVQESATPENIFEAAKFFYKGEESREKTITKLSRIKNILNADFEQEENGAAKRIAKKIYDAAKTTK